MSRPLTSKPYEIHGKGAKFMWADHKWTNHIQNSIQEPYFCEQTKDEQTLIKYYKGAKFWWVDH